MRNRILVLLLLLTQLCWADPIPANKAFVLDAKVRDPNTVQLQWSLPKGYFLYRDRFKVVTSTPDILTIAPLRLPRGTIKHDQEFGQLEIYRNSLALSVSVLGQAQGQGQIKVSYQGCSDSGFCYPPITQGLSLTLDEDRGLREISMDTLVATPHKLEAISLLDGPTLLFHHHIVLSMLAFWLLGLLLAFTPCILPMIPVLSGIIVGHHETLTTRKAFLLSLMYVLGMSLTYALVGVIIASLGANLQAMMQNIWVIGFFAAFFVLMSLSMFGYFELTLPAQLQSRFAALSQNSATGSYIGSAIMGSLSTLILSPCVTPALAGVLGYVATSGNVGFGAIALFCLSLGMGTPLLCIGTSAGRLLPKAGYWMNGVKNALGIILLAVAINLLARILPGSLVLLLWATLFILLGTYLGALQRKNMAYSWLWQGLGILLLLYGLICVLGASMGHVDVTKPLMNNQTTNQSVRVTNLDELRSEINNAANKPILLDFYADWCTSCKIQEKHIFQQSDVKEALQFTHVVRVDVTSNDEAVQALMKKYGVIAPPTLIWLDRNKNVIAANTRVGEITKGEFLRTLALVKSRDVDQHPAHEAQP